MDKKYILQITNNLYRLTLLFPKKEPLRYKMRELADDILAHFFNNQHPELVKDLEVLDSFFEVAKSQKWVKKEELLNLQQEYIKLKEDLEKSTIQNVEVQDVEVRPPQIPQLIPGPGKEINQRQEKILAFLRENGKAQVWQVKQILPEVSKRTLRRDFEFLLKQGKIERIGERNETFYVPRQEAGQLLG
jgi:hypothetical protein